MTITYFGNFTTSIAVTNKISTDISEYFLEDLAQWANKNYDIDIIPVVPTTYHSQLHVVFDKDLNHRLAVLQSLGSDITQCFRNYGFANYPDFEPIGFSMHIRLH